MGVGVVASIAFDEEREQRLARQKGLSLVPAETQLPPRNDGVAAWDSLGADERLYAKYRAIDPDTLNSEQRQALKNALRNFVLSGAELQGDAKKRFATIQERQAEVSQLFSEHVLDATDAWEELITDEADLAAMIATSLEIDDRPSAFRYPRGDGVGVEIPELAAPLEIGKGRIVREGASVAILSLGTRLQESLKAADMLAAKGVSATVADARFAKPLDHDLIRQLARHHQVVVTVEEGAVGGFGSHVMHFLVNEGLLDNGLKVRSLVLPDVWMDQAKPETMYAKAGLDSAGILKTVFAALGQDVPGVIAAG